MLHLSSEDIASVVAIVGCLEDQAGKLGSKSKIAYLWRDWSDLLKPSTTGETDHALTVALDQVTPSRQSATGG